MPVLRSMAPIDNTPQPVKEIILRFLEGNASESDVAILFDWLKESKENQRYFDEVNTTYQASVTLNRFTPQKTDDAWTRLSKVIETKKGVVRGMPRPVAFRYRSLLKIAASVSLIAVSGFLIFKLLPKETVQQGTIVRTATGNNTRILLPDSSVVWLNSNSTLEYPPAFGSESRNVVLKGEAFFDVRKGDKPFMVKTDNILVHVKGTKFNVQAYKSDQTVKTTLQEGKVELQVSGEDKVYTMQPGDQVVLDTKFRKVTLNKVDPSDFSAWKEEKLVFENVMLGSIVSKLENRFGVTIELDSMVARRERLSMTIERESLPEVLDLIQLSSHLHVKKEKNKIILYQ
jgi:transmembrane sensor